MTEIIIAAFEPFEQWMSGRVLAESGVLDKADQFHITQVSDPIGLRNALKQRYDVAFLFGNLEAELTNGLALAGVPTFVICESPLDSNQNRFIRQICLDDFDGQIFMEWLAEITSTVEASQ